MRKSLLLVVLTALLCSCASTGRMYNEALHYALVGQDEMTLYSRLGAPARTIPASEGQKIMIYEFYSKGMFETPYKSKVTYHAAANTLENPKGLTINTASTKTNDDKYTVYQKDLSWLKVFLDKEGKCVRFEENLTKEQLERYYGQFKRYVPKEKKQFKV